MSLTIHQALIWYAEAGDIEQLKSGEVDHLRNVQRDMKRQERMAVS